MLNSGVLVIEDASGRVSTCPLVSFPAPYFNGGTPVNDYGQLVIVYVADNGVHVGGLLYDESGGIVTGEQAIPAFSLDLSAAPLDPSVSFSRASIGTCFDDTGTLVTRAVNEPRFEHTLGSGVPRGLLIEEPRTNSIRNNTMRGVVPGSPGGLPNFWSVSYPGLTREVIGTGKENGIDYVDIRFFGTSSVASAVICAFEDQAIIAASIGQAWAQSVYLKQIAGDTSGFDFNLRLSERNDAGTSISSQASAGFYLPVEYARKEFAVTTANSNTAFVVPQLSANIAIGVEVDFTFRIGMPQLELGAFSTSVIPTSSSAVTRTADVASVSGANFSNWYNPSEGTFVWQGSMLYAAEPVSRLLCADDGTSQQNIRFVAGNFQVINAGATQASLTIAAPVNNMPYTLAGAYKTDDFVAASDGSVPATDTLGTIPIVNRLYLGTSGATLNNPTCCCILKVEYFNTRLSNLQVQGVSDGKLDGDIVGFSSGLAVDHRGALVIDYVGNISSWVAGLPVNSHGALCVTTATPPPKFSFSNGFSNGFDIA